MEGRRREQWDTILLSRCKSSRLWTSGRRNENGKPSARGRMVRESNPTWVPFTGSFQSHEKNNLMIWGPCVCAHSQNRAWRWLKQSRTNLLKRTSCGGAGEILLINSALTIALALTSSKKWNVRGGMPSQRWEVQDQSEGGKHQEVLQKQSITMMTVI